MNTVSGRMVQLGATASAIMPATPDAVWIFVSNEGGAALNSMSGPRCGLATRFFYPVTYDYPSPIWHSAAAS
jgi:hypothetical protein